MNCKQQAGFSLIELVIGIALMAIIISSVVGLFTNLLMQGVRGADLIDRQQEARWAVNMMTQDVRYATAYTVTTDPAFLQVSVTNSIMGTVQITYNLSTAGILQRTVFDAAKNTTVTSPIGNANRGFVGDGDFNVTTTVDPVTEKVTQVTVVYKIRKNATDTSAAIAQTTVYPLNSDSLILSIIYH
jgi:prepilin-type N-terminal cleavage/methylation domain-containing protein